MALKARLTDFHGIRLAQADVTFAIPFLDEDLPFSIDPFLLFKSPSQVEQGLHSSAVSRLNEICGSRKYSEDEAIKILVSMSECSPIGLGSSGTRVGRRIGEQLAKDILTQFKEIPSLRIGGLKHIEELQFIVDGIGQDRISDFTGNLIFDALVDYTMMCSRDFGIPCEPIQDSQIDSRVLSPEQRRDARIPNHPLSGTPILLVPKRWLRKSHFVNVSDYKVTEGKGFSRLDRAELLNFNRQNFDEVRSYVEARERSRDDCQNDPLFSQLPMLSAKRKLNEILKLKSGTVGKAHRSYEDNVVALLSTLLYPHLDFAQDQVRTDSGTQIRDLMMFNTNRNQVLKEWTDKYRSSQIVFEMKNVGQLEKEHVNQLFRYLSPDIGSLGFFVTRNPVPKQIQKHIVDIWSGHRKCIMVVTDKDLEQMVDMYETKSRDSFDMLTSIYLQYQRKLPT